MRATVAVLRGKHTFPEPRGLRQEVARLLETAGFSGHFDLHMLTAVTGTPRTQGIRIIRPEIWAIFMKVHPLGAPNTDCRKCWLILQKGMDPRRTAERLRHACEKLYGPPDDEEEQAAA